MSEAVSRFAAVLQLSDKMLARADRQDPRGVHPAPRRLLRGVPIEGQCRKWHAEDEPEYVEHKGV